MVMVRPVLPQDDVLAQMFVRGLSPESRYQRFLVGMSELPPGMLAAFTQVDYRSHLALLAEIFEEDAEVQIGEARYVVDGAAGDGGLNADFAIAVADGWNRLGVGSRLLRGLESAARAAGVTRFTGDVLRDNRRAIDFMRYRGFTFTANRDEARLVRAVKDL
jgi:acetyltransferase